MHPKKAAELAAQQKNRQESKPPRLLVFISENGIVNRGPGPKRLRFPILSEIGKNMEEIRKQLRPMRDDDWHKGLTSASQLHSLVQAAIRDTTSGSHLLVWFNGHGLGAEEVDKLSTLKEVSPQERNELLGGLVLTGEAATVGQILRLYCNTVARQPGARDVSRMTLWLILETCEAGYCIEYLENFFAARSAEFNGEENLQRYNVFGNGVVVVALAAKDNLYTSGTLHRALLAESNVDLAYHETSVRYGAVLPTSKTNSKLSFWGGGVTTQMMRKLLLSSSDCELPLNQEDLSTFVWRGAKPQGWRHAAMHNSFQNMSLKLCHNQSAPGFR